GPGRGPYGGLLLKEFTVTASPANEPSNSKPVVFRRAIADPFEPGFEVGVADGTGSGRAILWREDSSHLGQSHVAVFELREPVSFPNGMIFTFTLEQMGGLWPRNIGRFRLSAATSQLPFTSDGLPKLPVPEPVAPLPIVRAVNSLTVDPD